MNRGGLCETCLAPGACCRAMHLSGGAGDMRMDAPMSFDQAEHLAMKHRLPFRPGRQLDNGHWLFWCTKLGPDGRCGDYENRPALCRTYAAGSDGLCVHHQQA